MDSDYYYCNVGDSKQYYAMGILKKNVIYTIVLLMRLITLSSWNMRGWRISEPFLLSLLKDCDIMCIQEHMLYQCEQSRICNCCTGFNAVVKSSRSLDNINCANTLAADVLAYCIEMY